MSPNCATRKCWSLRIGTKVYDETLSFVEKLSLTLVEDGKSLLGIRFSLFTDGRCNILIDETNSPDDYGGLNYFNSELADLLPKLKELGFDFEEIKQEYQLFSAMLSTPDGVVINIVNADLASSPDPMGESIIDFGKFGEYAIKVDSLDDSISFWEKVGFKTLHRHDEWKYAIITDGIFVLGLHSHDMDARPALTYFDGNMPNKVELLRHRGIEMRSEKEYDAEGKKAIDATSESPGGQVWYFFTGNV